jgi:hypothetical protein
MASMAVASSLMEGVASLVLPNAARGAAVPGTRSSDYQYNGANATANSTK